MARYISNVVVEGGIISFYDQCGDLVQEVDICGLIEECSGQTPIEDDDGEWPEPFPNAANRCRVAIHVGADIAARLDNFLDGLNLNTQSANVEGPYIVTKLAEYGWPIQLYNTMLTFYYTLFDAGGAGRGAAAEVDYTASTTDDITNTQESLYCALGDDGGINTQNREIFAQNLDAVNSDFEEVLADFVRLWPLEDLKQRAYIAAADTSAVNCAAFDCVGSIDPCGDTILATWNGQTIEDYGFVAMTGDDDIFPGFRAPGDVHPISVVRDTNGFINTTYCTSSTLPCQTVAIQRTWGAPITLCNVKLVTSKVPLNKLNTRIGAIYVKRAGESTWTLLEMLTLSPYANPTTLTVNWDGLEVIDALALVAAAGGERMAIKSAEINV